MYPDTIDLRQFYETALGRTTRRMIRRKLRQFWPSLTGLSVLGLGYATPYLRTMLDETSKVYAAMTPHQGVSHWPDEGPNLVSLVDEEDLPFPDCSFDRILMIHSLEVLEHQRPSLREIWRVLSENGRIIVITPNRRGVWARTERTPFGYGSPYSASQLSQVLRDSLFVPEHSARCLYFPPTQSRFFLTAAAAWEKLGEQWFSSFGGVTIVEASKQIYALPINRTLEKRRRLAQIPFLVPSQTSPQE